MVEVDVRIRHEYAVDPVHLCAWPLNQLDALIDTVKKWGVADHDGDLCGQFVVDDTRGAYFELVLAAEGGF